MLVQIVVCEIIACGGYITSCYTVYHQVQSSRCIYGQTPLSRVGVLIV